MYVETTKIGSVGAKDLVVVLGKGLGNLVSVTHPRSRRPPTLDWSLVYIRWPQNRTLKEKFMIKLSAYQ